MDLPSCRRRCTSMHSVNATLVVNAAVIGRDDRYLVTRRQRGVHLEGFWEFPGGKCNAGESLPECLARELREELNVEAQVGGEIHIVTHRYDDRTVELHFIRAETDLIRLLTTRGVGRT